MKDKKYRKRRELIIYFKSVIPIGDYCRRCPFRKMFGRYTNYLIVNNEYFKITSYGIKCVPFNINSRKDVTFGEGVKSCGYNLEYDEFNGG